MEEDDDDDVDYNFTFSHRDRELSDLHIGLRVCVSADIFHGFLLFRQTITGIKTHN